MGGDVALFMQLYEQYSCVAATQLAMRLLGLLCRFRDLGTAAPVLLFWRARSLLHVCIRHLAASVVVRRVECCIFYQFSWFRSLEHLAFVLQSLPYGFARQSLVSSLVLLFSGSWNSLWFLLLRLMYSSVTYSVFLPAWLC
ncbi:hypothetical protein KC19_VG293800 [Ceratodon purpureus]|uniref:Uncharacterized protein n=1 Tax=Ceratodon purpureus TaxID=3225 RepID=A0A8T0HWH9_CERPU|nr:hypothetical protein KC19_VG293800 [Ceratodon purpureus]